MKRDEIVEVVWRGVVIADEQGPSESIRIECLDEFMGDEQVKRFDVLKVDVEGSELAVLEGAQECLQRWRPHVLFETSSEQRPEAYAGIVRLLDSLGYRIHDFDPITGRLASPCETPRSPNVVAVHQSRWADVPSHVKLG